MTNENDFFVKYPIEYLSKYNELFLLLYVYLHRHRSIEGYINLTVKDFLAYYNIKQDRNKGRINNKVYDMLQFMIDDGFISFTGCYSNGGLAEVNSNSIHSDMMFTLQIINDEKWNPENRFVKIKYSEIDILRRNINKKIGKILLLFLNIKKRISVNGDGSSSVHIAFPSEGTLSKECSISIRIMKEYIKKLCDCNMLYMTNYGSYKRMKNSKEIICNSNNIYALDEKFLQSEKDVYISYLKDFYSFIDGFYSFCNNLPDKTDENNIADTSDNDYSIEQILDMVETSTVNENDYDNVWD